MSAVAAWGKATEERWVAVGARVRSSQPQPSKGLKPGRKAPGGSYHPRLPPGGLHLPHRRD